MRFSYFIYFIALLLSSTMLIQPAQAVPLTGQVGPGGVGRTNGTTPLVLWLQADTLALSSGAAVSAWTDSSGKANHASQTTPAQRPVFQATVLNGRPSVEMTQVNSQFLNTTNSISNSGAESFFFATLSSGGGDKAFFGNTGNGNYTLRDRNSAVEWNVNGFDAPPNFGSGIRSQPAVGTSAMIFSGVREAAPGNGTIALYKNGSLNGVVGTGHTAVVTGRYIVGSRGGSSEFFNGQMGEVIAYADNVTTTERTLVENYLSAKFGLAISNNVYDGDTLHSFSRNVFGVGQSASDGVGITNAGAAGFGIEITSGLNAGEFVAAGHNVVTNSLVAFTGPPNFVGQQWQRSWFVDFNNSTLDVQLGFNFNDAGLTGLYDVNADYQLLYSATNALGTFEVLPVTFATLAGDTGPVVTFNLTSGSLLDGFYTLGINIGYVPEPNSLLLMLGVLGCGMLRRRRTLPNGSQGQAKISYRPGAKHADSTRSS